MYGLIFHKLHAIYHYLMRPEIRVLGIYPNGGLMANLIEKVSCIIIMGILFYKDSKQIRWEGKKLSLYSVIIMIIIGICACIGVNMLFELTGLKTIREEDAKNVAKALFIDFTKAPSPIFF